MATNGKKSKSGNSRFFVTVSDEMIAKLDTLAESLGMSRSGLCAYFIGSGMLGFEKSLSMLDTVSVSASDTLKKALKDSTKTA